MRRVGSSADGAPLAATASGSASGGSTAGETLHRVARSASCVPPGVVWRLDGARLEAGAGTSRPTLILSVEGEVVLDYEAVGALSEALREWSRGVRRNGPGLTRESER
jgi:hypothetical protein